jgi:hypothetical protein
MLLAEGVGFVGALLRGDPEDVSKALRRELTYKVFFFFPPPAFQFSFASPGESFGTTIFTVDKLNRSPLTRVLGSFT